MRKYPKPWKRKGSRYYYFAVSIEGKQKMISTGYTTPQEAAGFIVQYFEKREEITGKSPTLRDYAAPFFKWSSCPHVRRLLDEEKNITRRHVRITRSIFEKHVLEDELADMPLREIKTGDLLDFRSRIRLKGLAAGSVNHIMGALKIVFKEAVLREDLDADATVHIGVIKESQAQVGVFSQKELKTLFPGDGTGPWADLKAYVCFLIAAVTGCRRGEILALQWKHVYFEEKCLSIEQALKSETELGLPKWGKRRVVPLPDVAIKGLNHLREDGIYVAPDDWIFSLERGLRCGFKWWRNAFDRGMKAAGIDRKARGIKAHSFRHTLNTLLRSTNIEAEKIRQALGWSQEKTQQRYDHWQAGHFQGQVDFLNKLFK